MLILCVCLIKNVLVHSVVCCYFILKRVHSLIGRKRTIRHLKWCLRYFISHYSSYYFQKNEFKKTDSATSCGAHLHKNSFLTIILFLKVSCPISHLSFQKLQYESLITNNQPQPTNHSLSRAFLQLFRHLFRQRQGKNRLETLSNQEKRQALFSLDF